MSKSVSLLLSAALTLGSVFSTSSAPLAKKAGAANSQSPLAAKVQQTSVTKTPMIVSRAMAAAGTTKGLVRVQSEIKAANKAALRSATSASRAVAAGTDLRGTLSFRASWENAQPQYGIFKVPYTSGGAFEMIVPNNAPYLVGYDDGDGTFYGLHTESFMGFLTLYYLDTVDIASGEVLNTVQVDQTLQAFDTATDPVTGDVYGQVVDVNGQGFCWARIDYSVPSREDIGLQDVQLVGVGATSTGQFYGVGRDGVFYKVEKETGELEAIGVTGLDLKYLTGGCVNTGDETFLMAFNNDSEAGLAEIDIATGEATLLANFADDEEVNCLYVWRPAAADKAPAAPGLSVSCDNGSMDVNVTLTLPTTLFDGTPASGQTFTYSVLANGGEVLTGEAGAGDVVTKAVTLTNSGNTKFVATVSNSTGSSPKAKASCFVGKGSPAAPKNVVLAWADGTATLTWDAVTASSDGGYIDPAAVTYTILDENGAELATQSATTFTASVPASASYTVIGYSVKANYDGKSSAAVASNKVALGSLSTPLSMDMTNADNFEAHTVLDANGDGKTWNFASGKTRYSYSASNDADDWLFSPPVKLEGGKIYLLSALASANGNTFPERIEISLGSATTAAGMTQQVVAPTVLVGTDATELSGRFTVDATGVYYVGFHALSDADSYYLNLMSYEISAPISTTAPAAPENLAVTADSEGALRASISFKAPSKSMDGNQITGDVKVKILRGDDFVGEVSVAAGNNGSVEDKSVPALGTYKYTAVAVNAAGEEGMPASVSAYVGPTAPATVAEVDYVENGDGTLTLSWSPVTADVDGNPINAAYVTYNVWSVVEGYLGEVLNSAPITATNFTLALASDQQDLITYAVQAVNRGREGNPVAVNCLVGTPYEMPVSYTGESSLDEYLLLIGGAGQIGLGSSQSGFPAQDGDDSYFVIQHKSINGETYLETGKIKVDAENPVITLWEYKVAAEDINETVVTAIVDGETVELGSVSNSDAEMGWNRRKFSLASLKGKIARIRITAICKSHEYSLYDNIKVANDLNYDLAASISAPAKVATGEEFEVKVTVANYGAEDSDSYLVNLLRDGEVVESKTFSQGLASDKEEVVIFKQSFGVQDGETATFKAVVVYEADEVPENNQTEEVSVSRKISTLPAVTGLQGEKTDAGNALSWDPIVIDEPSPKEVTETFEDAESWAHELDGWTFVDVDKSAVGGFQNTDLPGITPGTTLASFFVFDTTLEGVNANPTFAAHSGEKYLAALFRYDDGQTDDWAISPLLTGEAQTVSFFAKSYSAQYPEEIELWYSTSDTEVESFIQIEEFGTQTLSAEWTEYSAQLPQGAKHFAIRSCASSSFMLMIDDITFSKIDGFDGKLQGYNVYCDGVKLNDAPVAEASYLHVPADDAAHTYHVTAVYDKGESEFSAPVTIDQSGIDSILAAGLKVAVEGKSIVVTGAGDNLVTINAVDGKTIHAAKGDTRVAVSSAIYLVTVDRKTVKVIVR